MNLLFITVATILVFAFPGRAAEAAGQERGIASPVWRAFPADGECREENGTRILRRENSKDTGAGPAWILPDLEKQFAGLAARSGELEVSLDCFTASNPSTRFRIAIENNAGTCLAVVEENVYFGWERKKLRFSAPSPATEPLSLSVTLLTSGEMRFRDLQIAKAQDRHDPATEL